MCRAQGQYQQRSSSSGRSGSSTGDDEAAAAFGACSRWSISRSRSGSEWDGKEDLSKGWLHEQSARMLGS